MRLGMASSDICSVLVGRAVRAGRCERICQLSIAQGRSGSIGLGILVGLIVRSVICTVIQTRPAAYRHVCQLRLVASLSEC